MVLRRLSSQLTKPPIQHATPIQPWEQAKVPPGFWNEETNVRNYMEWLRTKLHIDPLEGWYSVKNSDLAKHRGQGLLLKYNGSVSSLVTSVFPSEDWKMWRFSRTPKKFWSDPKNRLAYMEWLGDKLGYEKPEDWYKITQEEIIIHGGARLLKIFGNSPSKLVQAVAPISRRDDWHPWMFSRRKGSSEYWNDIGNRRKYFEWLANKLAVSHPEGWYSVKHNDIVQNHGATLLKRCGSLQSALQNTYPDVLWLSWRFQPVSPGFWDKYENRQAFFSWLSKKLSISDPSQWYSVSVNTIHENGGGGLIASRYNGCLEQALRDVYPKYKWDPWKFNKVPVGTSLNSEIVTDYLKYLAEELKIRRPSDWYRIDKAALRKHGGISIIDNNGGLAELLPRAFPEYLWESQLFSLRIKKSSQRQLFVLLLDMFPETKIMEDFLHPDLQFSSSMPMELDLWIPEKNLAFEYQGVQHYKTLSVFGNTNSYQERDKEKTTQCAKHKILLILVPYWWDGTLASLRHLIEEQDIRKTSVK